MDNPREAMNPLEQIAAACNGTITEVGALPDGSGFAIMSMPLRKDHWIYDKGPTHFNVPPMPLRMRHDDGICIAIGAPYLDNGVIGTPERPVRELGTLTKREAEHMIRECGKYAVRCATMNGSEMDFDPDALLQNLAVAFLGYWSDTGISGDDWANPQEPFDFHPPESKPRNLPGCEPTTAPGENPSCQK